MFYKYTIINTNNCYQCTLILYLNHRIKIFGNQKPHQPFSSWPLNVIHHLTIVAVKRSLIYTYPDVNILYNCVPIPSNEELSDDDGDSVGAVVNSLAAALVVLLIEPSVSSPKDGTGDGGTVDVTEGDGCIVEEEEEEDDGCWVGWGRVEGGGSVCGGVLLLGRKRLILRLTFLMTDHRENSVMDILPYLLPIENSPAPLTGLNSQDT